METMASNLSSSTPANLAPENSSSRATSEIVCCSVFLSVIVLVTIAGNAMVIIATARSNHLREQVSIAFIINLSITDLTICVLVMPTALLAIGLDVRHVDDTWCKIVCATNYCCITVSMLTLACISVERYVAVLHPLKHLYWLTTQKVRVMIACTWTQGLLTGCAPVVLDWISYDYWEGICAIQWQLQYTMHYVCVAFVLCFFLPGVVILASYLSIVFEIKKHSAALRQVAVTRNTVSFPAVLPAHLYDKTSIERTKKTVNSVLVLVVIFFLCMTPFSLTKLLKVVGVDSIPQHLNLVASYCAYLASAVNPFIYGLFRPDFRKEYKRIVEELKTKLGSFS